MSLSKKAAKAKTIEKKSILNWLNKLTEDGSQLSIAWEGGGDSGWAYFEIDGHQTEDEYTNAIIDYMYEMLDYGSWAGEFTANGRAIYNPETRTFEGTDYYGEDGNEIIDVDIKILVPKKLWFDSVHIECEASYDESSKMSVRTIVKNGFTTGEHSAFCSNLEQYLQDKFDALFSNFESSDYHEFRGCNDSWIVERSEMKEEEDMLVFTINKIDVMTIDTQEKYVSLELTDDIIEDIDQKLNDTQDDN